MLIRGCGSAQSVLSLDLGDLQAALRWAGARPRGQSKRVILVTDGVPTVGETEPTRLREAAAALKNSGIERVDLSRGTSCLKSQPVPKDTPTIETPVPGTALVQTPARPSAPTV